MKLEDKVLSLELSKELWDRGVRIESEFIRYVGTERVDKRDIELWQIEENPNTPVYPAPLLIELLEVMPRDLGEGSLLIGMPVNKDEGYISVYPKTVEEPFFDLNPANAVAKTLIWLLDEGHITIQEINNERD